MSNCGCDGNNNNLNILQRNNLLPGNTGNNGVLNVQSMNNMPQVNNFPQVNNQPVQVQPVQVQMANNQESIGPINNLVKGDAEEETVVADVTQDYRQEAKMVLYFLLALAIHDAVKFFISNSIRMNRGSSSRFLYYPVVVLAVLILINLF